MRHIISVLLANEVGALSRVAGMFSARGFNIESLTVAPTHDDAVSRLTLVTSGSAQIIEQINKQLHKLVDVVELADMTAGDHFERDLLLLKLIVEAGQLGALNEAVARFNAQILDDDLASFTIEFSGTAAEVDALVEACAEHAQVHELVRTGVGAIACGSGTLH